MTDRKQKLAAIDAALRGAFNALEARGVPEHLSKIVDQLDEAAAAGNAASDTVEADEVRPSPGPPSSPEP